MRNFEIFAREAMFPRTTAEGGESVAPLAIVGKLDSYTSFEGIVRHNAKGTWKLALPADHPQASILIPGRGVVVFQEGESEPLLSGPITEVEKVWDESNAGAGTVAVSGVDDNYLLGERLAWSNPTADIHLASLFQHWQSDPTWPNVAELLRQLFKANFHGHPARRLDRIFIPDESATVNFLNDDAARVARLKFDRPDQLVSLLSAVYGFRIRFVWHRDPASVASNGLPGAGGPGILLKLEPLRDLTGDVQFGPELGNLRGYTYKVKAPEASRLVIGCQNRTWREEVEEPTYDDAGVETGHTKTTVEHSTQQRWFGYYSNREYDPEWWGDPEMTPADQQHTLPWAQAGFSATEVEWGFTTERYKDRRDVGWQWVQDPGKPEGWTQDPPAWSPQNRAIQDEVDGFSLDQGPMASISIDPIETDRAVYGLDYGLGDVIRIFIDGEARNEIVREVRLTSTPEDGPRVSPTVGTYGSSETPFLYSQVRSLWDRVTRVEAREDLRVLEEVPVSDFVLKKAI